MDITSARLRTEIGSLVDIILSTRGYHRSLLILFVYALLSKCFLNLIPVPLALKSYKTIMTM